MSYLNMDLSDAKVGLDFEPVPAGDYQAQVIDSELTQSKSDNTMLTLTWLVIDGEQAERLIFDRVMLSGSDKSVAFGKRRLKTIADAIGHPNPNRIEDSGELHGLPCLITVAVRKSTEGYSDSNEVRNYHPLANAAPQRAPAAPPANTSPAQVAAPPNSRAQTPPPARGNTPSPRGAQKPQTPFDPPPAETNAPM